MLARRAQVRTAYSSALVVVDGVMKRARDAGGSRGRPGHVAGPRKQANRERIPRVLGGVSCRCVNDSAQTTVNSDNAALPAKRDSDPHVGPLSPLPPCSAISASQRRSFLEMGRLRFAAWHWPVARLFLLPSEKADAQHTSTLPSQKCEAC